MTPCQPKGHRHFAPPRQWIGPGKGSPGPSEAVLPARWLLWQSPPGKARRATLGRFSGLDGDTEVPRCPGDLPLPR